MKMQIDPAGVNANSGNPPVDAFSLPLAHALAISGVQQGSVAAARRKFGNAAAGSLPLGATTNATQIS